VWVVIKYFLNRDPNEAGPNKPSAQEKSRSGNSVDAASGLAADRDLRVGGNVSIKQNQLSGTGIVLAVIGLLFD
jgi:hypothetical protein